MSPAGFKQLRARLHRGEFAVAVDAFTAEDCRPNLSLTYHPKTREQFDELVEALGGIDAAAPIAGDERYSVKFRLLGGGAGGIVDTYGAGGPTVCVYKPHEPDESPQGDPFFAALRERQQATTAGEPGKEDPSHG